MNPLTQLIYYVVTAALFTHIHCIDHFQQSDQDQDGNMFYQESQDSETEKYEQYKRFYTELSDRLLFDNTLEYPSTCDTRLLWVKFNACYHRQMSITPVVRWRKNDDMDDFHILAEEYTLKTWCKSKIFFECWHVFEDSCPHATDFFSFIPNFLRHVCFIYDQAERDHFGPCSFYRLQKLFLKENEKIQTLCKTNTSMGPLIIDHSFEVNPSISLFEPRFEYCIKDLLRTWIRTKEKFQLVGCGKEIIDKVSDMEWMDRYLEIFVQFIRRNKHELDEVLYQRINEVKDNFKDEYNIKPHLFTHDDL